MSKRNKAKEIGEDYYFQAGLVHEFKITADYCLKQKASETNNMLAQIIEVMKKNYFSIFFL